ncbi:hypothetical protein D3C72_1963050 [compost metagenome]
MPDFDRFQPPGPRDERRTIRICAWCGGDIYVGDTVTSVYAYNAVLHSECEYAWIESSVIKERGVIDSDGDLT